MIKFKITRPKYYLLTTKYSKFKWRNNLIYKQL